MARTGSTVTKRTIADTIKSIRQNAAKSLVQGIVDQFAPVKDISTDAYKLLRLSKGATGAFEAFMHHGKLNLKDGAYDADTSGGVMQRVFIPLGQRVDGLPTLDRRQPCRTAHGRRQGESVHARRH
jgi:hypothetical protein